MFIVEITKFIDNQTCNLLIFGKYRVNSEFVREGKMFTNGSVVCLVTRLYSITESGNPNATLLYDPTYHVEISKLINKGANLKVEELVQFAELLHP